MAVSYNRLWKLLIDKGITKTEMRKRAVISTSVFPSRRKRNCINGNIGLDRRCYEMHP